MKLLIIRHADPDYEHDSLTPKGFHEAELLARKLVKQDITAAYVSPLGRAKDTAAPTLSRLNLEAEECDWLHEFDLHRIWRPDVADRRMIVWDWLPQDWMSVPAFFDNERWDQHPLLKEAGIGDYYREVADHFDALLAKHGYRREGRCYRVERENDDTIALFCHFGSGCVLLSRILNISPMILWHSYAAAPSSVTTVVTEERREGTAIMRVTGMGDISHLYAGDEPPSFACRFCECFHNEDERHD